MAPQEVKTAEEEGIIIEGEETYMLEGEYCNIPVVCCGITSEPNYPTFLQDGKIFK